MERATTLVSPNKYAAPASSTTSGRCTSTTGTIYPNYRRLLLTVKRLPASRCCSAASGEAASAGAGAASASSAAMPASDGRKDEALQSPATFDDVQTLSFVFYGVVVGCRGVLSGQ